MSFKNLWSQRKEKHSKVAMRVFAVLLALAIVVPGLITTASRSDDGSPEEHVQILGESGEDSVDPPVDEEDLPVPPKEPVGISISAPDRTLSLEQMSTFDPLEGVTVTASDGEDYHEFLEVTLPEDSLLRQVGEVTLYYAIVVEGEELAHATSLMTLVSDYTIEAEELTLFVGQYESNDDFDALDGVIAQNGAGEDVSEFLQLVEQEDEMPLDVTTAGIYKLKYALIIDDMTLAQATRVITVADNGYTFFAPTLTFYIEDLKTQEKGFAHLLMASFNARNADGDIMNEYVVIADDGGGGAFNVQGRYEVTYEVVIEGETVASTKRYVIIDSLYEPEMRARSQSGNRSVRLGGMVQYNHATGEYENEDNLSVIVETNGRTQIRKWHEAPANIAEHFGWAPGTKTWVPQYYKGEAASYSRLPHAVGQTGANNNGIVLVLGDGVEQNIYGSSYFGNTLKPEGVVDKTTNAAVEQIAERKYVVEDGKGTYIIERITLPKGGNTIERTWSVKAGFATDYSDVRLFYGGDTYFSGYDSGWSRWTDNSGGMALTWRAKEQGMMALRGSNQHPPSSYYTGWFGLDEFVDDIFAGKEQILENGQLDPDSQWSTAHRGNGQMLDLGDPAQRAAWEDLSFKDGTYWTPYLYHDAGYYLQWNLGTIDDNNLSKEVVSYETFADAGNIQIASLGDQKGPPDSWVTHEFTVKNNALVTGETFEVHFYAESENGWTTKVEPSTMPALAPNDIETVTVRVIIPDAQPNGDPWPDGFADKLTLKAKYREDNGAGGWRDAEAVSTTRTILSYAEPQFNPVYITNLNQQTLQGRVTYTGVSAAEQPIQVRVTILDENLDKVPTIDHHIQWMSSGDLFDPINVSSLTVGETYHIRVEEVDFLHITTANSTTSFVYGDTIVAPTGIHITPRDKTINRGEVYREYQVDYTPANATVRDLLWTSSDPSVATIDQATGVVTGLEPGTVTIRAVLEADPYNVYDTVTLHVIDTVSNVLVTPDVVEMKVGDTVTVTGQVTPASSGNKLLDWSSLDATIATVSPITLDPSADNQRANITGVANGVTEIIAASNQTPAVTDIVTVRVDGLAPELQPFIVEKTGVSWNRSIHTKEQLKVTLSAIDHDGGSGWASGVSAIYYQVLTASDPAPTFDPANLTGWKTLTGSSGHFLLDSSNTGGDGGYKIYAVAIDRVGNYSGITDGNTDITVDTDKPEIGLITGASEDIHILTGDTPDLLADIIASDNGVDITSQLVITPNPLDTSVVGQQTITYFYQDLAGNSATFQRSLFVHGRPTISSQDRVLVNQQEEFIDLLPADARIQLVTPDIDFFDANGAPQTTPPDVKAVGLPGEVVGNQLHLPRIQGNTFPYLMDVTYEAWYNNPLTNPTRPLTAKDIVVEVYKNGTQGPTPEVDPDGPVTPPQPPTTPGEPDDPGTNPEIIDPLDPSGVYRVRYYQNNGIIMANDSRLPEAQINAALILNAVNAPNATKTVTIQEENGLRLPLDDSTLADALETVGQKTIRYRFEEQGTGLVSFFTVYLRVNSDIVRGSANPVEARQGEAVPTSDYTGQNSMTASYQSYTKAGVSLDITPPTAAEMDTQRIRSYEVSYQANYPYEPKALTRLLRVHGNVTLSSGDRFDMRIGGSLLDRYQAVVDLAPVGVGDTPVRKDVSEISLVGQQGDTSFVNQFRQDYTARYQLGAEYGSGQGFILTGDGSREVYVHSMPSLTATNPVVVGRNYTAEMFGTVKENALILLGAQVEYFGAAPEDIKAHTTVTGENAILFGTEGIYPITFTVDDTGVANRPAGLPGESDTLTIDFIISATAGNAPDILGNRDIDWLQGDTLTVSNILAHVSASDGTTGATLQPLYQIKDSSGTTVTLQEVADTVGEYTITYTVIDSIGMMATATNRLDTWGRIAFETGDMELDVPVGATAADLDFSGATASYLQPNGTKTTLTPASNPSDFTLGGQPIDLNLPGRYASRLLVTHPMFAHDTDDRSGDVRVHGVPTVTATNQVVRINNQSFPITVAGDDIDSRFHVSAPDYIYYARSGATVSEKTYHPEVTAEGEFVVNGKLDPSLVTGTLPVTTTVTFRVHQDNPMLVPSALSDSVTVQIEIYKNGTSPTDPDPEVDPEGPVTPPDPGGVDPDPGTDPESYDPLDPQGVYRIRYYQNHGIIMADDSRLSDAAITLSRIENAVSAPGADRREVYIADDSNVLHPLTDQTWANALQNTGNKRVVYRFVQDGSQPGDFAETFFTAYLRVNSDLTVEPADPIDTQLNTTLTDQDIASDTTNMKASFISYANLVEQVLVTANQPDQIDTTSVQSFAIDYTAAYPYEDKTIDRLLRVHGGMTFTINPVDLRVGAASVPLDGVSATVSLAPVSAGTTPVTKQVTDFVLSGLANLSQIGETTQNYQGTYQLGAEYGTGSSYQITDTDFGQVLVHGLPVIKVKEVTVGLGFTEAMLRPLSNAILEPKAYVEYASGTGTQQDDLSTSLEFVSHNIQFGVVGTYQLTYRVSDSNAPSRPTGLPAETITETFNFTISDAVSNQPPEILGATDLKWLEGTALTTGDLLQGVVGQDKTTNTSIPVLAQVYDSAGNIVTDLSQVTASYGQFTVRYTAVDSLGYIAQTSVALDVYGKIHFSSSRMIGESRETYHSSIVKDIMTKDGEATYRMPNGTLTTIKYKTSSQKKYFSVEGTVPSKIIGVKELPAKVTHPEFPSNTDDAIVEARINGLIQFLGVDEKAFKRYPTGAVVTLREDVTIQYKHWSGGMKELLDYEVWDDNDNDMTTVTRPVGSPGVVSALYIIDDDVIAGEVYEHYADFKFDQATPATPVPLEITMSSSILSNENRILREIDRLVKKVNQGSIEYGDELGSHYKTTFIKYDISKIFRQTTAGQYEVSLISIDNYGNIIEETGVLIVNVPARR